MENFNYIFLFLSTVTILHSSSSIISPSNAIVGMKNNTESSDLNQDVVLTIMEQLDLMELIELADTNKFNSHLAENVFRRRYPKVRINLHLPYRNWHENGKHIKEIGNTLIVINNGTAVKILKHFGHLFTNLRVMTQVNTETTRIGRLINLYCSELVEFDVEVHGIGSHNFFHEMTKPFEKVKSVSFSGRYLNFDSSNLTIDKLFPALRNLTLNSYPFENIKELPHLEHLYVKVAQLSMTQNEIVSGLRSWLCKNPHIQSVHIRQCTQIDLATVNDCLPNLERLVLDRCINSYPRPIDRLPIVFHNVKYLSNFNGHLESIINDIEFRNLIAYETDHIPRACNKWIDVLEQNRDLNTIAASVYDQQVEMLTMADIRLVNVDLHLKGDVSEDKIIAFIENGRQLKKIRLSFDNPALFDLIDATNRIENMIEVLRQRFSNEWIITTSKFEIFFTH